MPTAMSSPQIRATTDAHFKAWLLEFSLDDESNPSRVVLSCMSSVCAAGTRVPISMW